MIDAEDLAITRGGGGEINWQFFQVFFDVGKSNKINWLENGDKSVAVAALRVGRGSLGRFARRNPTRFRVCRDKKNGKTVNERVWFSQTKHIEAKEAPFNGAKPPEHGHATCSPAAKRLQHVGKYSAGLRVRTHPSLQSEQIGVVPVKGIIGYTDEASITRPSIFPFSAFFPFESGGQCRSDRTPNPTARPLRAFVVWTRAGSATSRARPYWNSTGSQIRLLSLVRMATKSTAVGQTIRHRRPCTRRVRSTGYVSGYVETCAVTGSGYLHCETGDILRLNKRYCCGVRNHSRFRTIYRYAKPRIDIFTAIVTAYFFGFGLKCALNTIKTRNKLYSFIYYGVLRLEPISWKIKTRIYSKWKFDIFFFIFRCAHLG